MAKARSRTTPGALAPRAAPSGKPEPPRGKPAPPGGKPASNALHARQLAKVRALCHSLPNVTERPSHGAPTFFVGARSFASFTDNHHGDGRLALWCCAPPGAQVMLVDSNPDHYFVPPYVGHLGWIGVRLDREAGWPEIAAVLESAYQARTTRRGR